MLLIHRIEHMIHFSAVTTEPTINVNIWGIGGSGKYSSQSLSTDDETDQEISNKRGNAVTNLTRKYGRLKLPKEKREHGKCISGMSKETVFKTSTRHI